MLQTTDTKPGTMERSYALLGVCEGAARDIESSPRRAAIEVGNLRSVPALAQEIAGEVHDALEELSEKAWRNGGTGARPAARSKWLYVAE